MTREPPQTLEELRSMSRDELLEVEKFQWGDGLQIKALIRHFVHLAAHELEWRGEENSMSLRGFWYSGVKQMLETAFPEKVEDPNYRFSRRMSQRLSEVLSDMVKDGEVSYRDLNIMDDSRDRLVHTDTIEDEKLLFVEKAAAYRNLKPLADVYEITLVSGGGWEATALIEDLSHELDPGKNYDLYVLADYDPTGDRIVKDFRRRAEQLGIPVRNVEPVGIRPEQLDPETVEVERFQPPADTDYEKQWLAEHGIEGQYGLEIEAIGDLQSKGADLRRVVVDAMKDDLDVRGRMSRDINTATANLAYYTADDLTDSLMSDVRARLIEEACDLVAEEEAVNSCEYVPDEDEVWASTDLDKARENGDLTPTPYNEDKLHEAAINPDFTPDGKALPPAPAKSSQRRRLRKRLTTALKTGKIDAEELLDL